MYNEDEHKEEINKAINNLNIDVEELENVKDKLDEEYEDEIWNLTKAIEMSDYLMEDWYSRNMLGDKYELLLEKRELIHKVKRRSDEIYDCNLDEIKSKIQRSKQKIHEYQEELSYFERRNAMGGEYVQSY